MYKVFVSSRNRPLYLWACLDSLYRLTRSAAAVTLIDSASDDMLVREVVRGFERRGLLREVVWLETNEIGGVIGEIARRLTPEDELFGFVEADTVILPGAFECWLGHMTGLMREDPGLAMLGSSVDTGDFVDPVQALRLEPDRPPQEVGDMIYYGDPGRRDHRPDTPEQLVFSPHNPPGRLLVLRREAILRAGHASDSDLHDNLRALGYRTGISTRVRHRHLSLLNIFDYPRYKMTARHDYMRGATYRGQAEARGFSRAAASWTREPDIHLLTGRGRIEPEIDGPWHRFRLAAADGPVWLASRRGFALDTADQRPLGIAIDRLLLDGEDMLRSTALAAGWYAPEEGWRWTAGRAELPPAREVALRLTGVVDYEA
ncbi:MAG TPA: glycosyltransferase family A protein [Acidiphilium sp.]|nr:glycosyltransferase family A protein [Acidiphilium sp.]